MTRTPGGQGRQKRDIELDQLLRRLITAAQDEEDAIQTGTLARYGTGRCRSVGTSLGRKAAALTYERPLGFAASLQLRDSATGAAISPTCYLDQTRGCGYQ